MITCKQNISTKKLLNLSSEEILNWLEENMLENVPEQLSTPEEIAQLKSLFNVITNKYAYVRSAALLANVNLRTLKAKSSFDKSILKSDIDEMMAKKVVLEGCANILDQQYASLSRAYTIIQDEKRENRMYNNAT